MKASIIIAFYNNIKALEFILTALNNQYADNFEVVIADDGSRQESVTALEKMISQFAYPIKHVWHEDLGFRKNKILNKAVMASHNEYLIFIDGDCIPQSNFVADHLFFSEQGACLNGRRADLSAASGPRLTLNHPERFFMEQLPFIMKEYLLGRGKNIEKGFRISNPILRKFLNRKKKGLVGCNFSLFKADLLKINGFDEIYEAPGIGEDTDIEARLRMIDIKIKNIFYSANQIHIYHQELPRAAVNEDILRDTIAHNRFYTTRGIVKDENA